MSDFGELREKIEAAIFLEWEIGWAAPRPLPELAELAALAATRTVMPYLQLPRTVADAGVIDTETRP